MFQIILVLAYLVATLVGLWFGVGHVFLLGALLIPMMIWLMDKPVHLLGVVIASYAWPYTVIESGGLTLFKFANLALVVLVLLRLAVRGRWHPMPFRFLALFGLLLPIQLVSEFFAPTGGDIGVSYVYASTWLLLLVMTQVIRGIADLKVLAQVFALNTIAMTLFVIRQTPLSTVMHDAFYRAKGPTNEPNELAWMLLVMLGIVVAGALDSRARLLNRLLCAVASVAGTISMVLSASRSGTIGLVVTGATFLVIVPRTTTSRIRAVALALAVSVAVIGMAPPTFQQRVVGMATAETRGHGQLGYSQRDVHAKIGWRMINERPFLGHGSLGFRRRYALLTGTSGRALHSSVINVAVAYGLPAGVLYALLLFVAVGAAWRLAWRSREYSIYGGGLAAALAGTAVSSLGAPRFFTPTMWALVTLAYILYAQEFGRSAAPASRPAEAGDRAAPLGNALAPPSGPRGAAVAASRYGDA